MKKTYQNITLCAIQQARNGAKLSEPDKDATASIIFNDERLIYFPLK